MFSLLFTGGNLLYSPEHLLVLFTYIYIQPESYARKDGIYHYYTIEFYVCEQVENEKKGIKELS
jgi:hypothetical protein